MTARVVQRLQGVFGQSVKLEPIIWEHEPMRATQHPQEQIPLPSECDIVVCLLWSRLGTRLPDKISAAGKTGTEWEFEEAARSFREKKTPDLLVYRKTKEVLASVDDETTYAEKKSQWNALSGFLTHWFNSEDGTFKAVFKTFEALDQFEDLLERDLRRLIQERLKLTPLAAKTWHHAAVPRTGGFRLRACADFLWPHTRHRGDSRGAGPASGDRAAPLCWSSA